MTNEELGKHVAKTTYAAQLILTRGIDEGWSKPRVVEEVTALIQKMTEEAGESCRIIILNDQVTTGLDGTSLTIPIRSVFGPEKDSDPVGISLIDAIEIFQSVPR